MKKRLKSDNEVEGQYWEVDIFGDRHGWPLRKQNSISFNFNIISLEVYYQYSSHRHTVFDSDNNKVKINEIPTFRKSKSIRIKLEPRSSYYSYVGLNLIENYHGYIHPLSEHSEELPHVKVLLIEPDVTMESIFTVEIFLPYEEYIDIEKRLSLGQIDQGSIYILHSGDLVYQAKKDIIDPLGYPIKLLITNDTYEDSGVISTEFNLNLSKVTKSPVSSRKEIETLEELENKKSIWKERMDKLRP